MTFKLNSVEKFLHNHQFSNLLVIPRIFFSLVSFYKLILELPTGYLAQFGSNLLVSQVNFGQLTMQKIISMT